MPAGQILGLEGALTAMLRWRERYIWGVVAIAAAIAFGDWWSRLPPYWLDKSGLLAAELIGFIAVSAVATMRWTHAVAAVLHGGRRALGYVLMSVLLMPVSPFFVRPLLAGECEVRHAADAIVLESDDGSD